MMDNKDKKQFGEIINGTAKLFEKDLTKPILTIYWDILKEYPMDEIKDAFNVACRQCKFFPKPAELIEIINGKGGTVDEIATKEATKVIEAMRRIGVYQSVRFDDPVTNAVVERGFGGWEEICNEILAENNKWFVRDFVALYKSYVASRIKSINVLPGIIEAGNKYNYLNKIHLETHILITDKILIGEPKEEMKRIEDKTE